MLTKTEVAPTVNASKSVNDVIVMATPLFFIIYFILSSIEAVVKDGASAIPDMSINMSSIPIPVEYRINVHLFQLMFNASNSS